jgi:hypothetical protein
LAGKKWCLMLLTEFDMWLLTCSRSVGVNKLKLVSVCFSTSAHLFLFSRTYCWRPAVLQEQNWWHSWGNGSIMVHSIP